MNKPKIIFFGTPQIAKIVLQRLFSIKNIELLAVVAQPDSMKNRKGEILNGAVKQFCLDHHIPIFQPTKISTIFNELNELAPDLIITCAYGQFIPQSIINIPKYKIVNVHASLLPKLRGGAPIHYAIINNEKETGITLMHTIKKMDAGNILFQRSIPINDQTTTKDLTLQLAELGADMIEDHLFDLLDENLVGDVQDEELVTFAYNITKEQTIINFNQSALMVLRFVNGMFDKPMALMDYKNNLIKIHKIAITTNKSTQTPGTVFIKDKKLYVATVDFNVELLLIQLPNKNPAQPNQILNGNNIFTS